MATIEPKIFRSGDYGAPVLNGTAGSLINTLDACLVNGYNSRSGITITREGSIATANFNNHGYVRDQIVEHSGADQSEYNGQVKVLSATANWYTFAVADTAITPATGTITCRVAPLGWIKMSGGTNIAFYRSDNALSTKAWLRVIDNGTVNGTFLGRLASFRGYEEVIDSNTFYAPFPRWDQSSYNYIQKVYVSESNLTNGKGWAILGDSMIFYLLNSWYEDATNWATLGMPSVSFFGDFISYRPADAFYCICCNNCTNFSAGYPSYDYAGLFSQNSTNPTYGNSYIARQFNQIGQSTGAAILQDSVVSRGLGDSGTTFPNPVDGSLIFGELSVVESGNYLRGRLPGVYSPSHVRPFTTPLNTVQQGSVMRNLGLSNKDYWISVIRTSVSTNNSAGQLMFDLTGPWR